VDENITNKQTHQLRPTKRATKQKMALVIEPFRINMLLWLIEGIVDASLDAGAVPLRTSAVARAMARHAGEVPTYWILNAAVDYGAALGLFVITTDRNDPAVQRVKVNSYNPILTSEDVSLLKAAASAYCFCVARRSEDGPECYIEDSWEFVNNRFRRTTCLQSVNGVVTGFRLPTDDCPCAAQPYSQG
jgi:hypothetical protein